MQQELGSFLDLCDRVGFPREPLLAKIAGALLGSEREKRITLQRKNGKSRVVGTFAAHHVLTTRGEVIVVANSKEQAEIIDRYSRGVAMHASVERRFEPRFRDCVALTVGVADEVCARPAPPR
jgi:hypothetical protein